MMNSSLVGYWLPALATAGYGLENLRNCYRRDCRLLEGFFEKKCHHTATPYENKGLHNTNERKMTSENCSQHERINRAGQQMAA
jgi:hypothetical protein